MQSVLRTNYVIRISLTISFLHYTFIDHFYACICTADNILVCLKTMEEHIQHLGKVFN